MGLPSSLHIALKEWKLLTDALASGRQILLLRKGGIYESGGEFELEHRQFLFFPTYVHQNLQMLKPDAQVGFQAYSAEPDQVTLAVAGEVTDVVQVQRREQIDRIDAEHIWTSTLIDMRFNYKPQNPLYLVLIRAYRLPVPVVVPNTPAYAGCKSWVPLDRSIAVDHAIPAMEDSVYLARRERVLAELK